MDQIDLTKNDAGPKVSDRSYGQLVVDASRELSELVQFHVALAKAELNEEKKHATVAGATFGIAAVFGFVGFILLCFTAAWGLVAAGLANWAAFGIVTLVLLIIAGTAAAVGAGRAKKIGPPQRAIESANHTVSALKGQR